MGSELYYFTVRSGLKYISVLHTMPSTAREESRYYIIFVYRTTRSLHLHYYNRRCCYYYSGYFVLLSSRRSSSPTADQIKEHRRWSLLSTLSTVVHLRLWQITKKWNNCLLQCTVKVIRLLSTFSSIQLMWLALLRERLNARCSRSKVQEIWKRTTVTSILLSWSPAGCLNTFGMRLSLVYNTCDSTFYILLYCCA